jgi:DNA-binding MarR family transcriptional regulator
MTLSSTSVAPATRDDDLAEQLERVARLVLRHRRAIVERHGLTPPLARALQRLNADRPRAMADLAEVLECDASNVTGIVDRLEGKGLVERRADEHDRRVKTVAVTPTGQRLARRLRTELASLPPSVAALAVDDRAALAALLGGIA